MRNLSHECITNARIDETIFDRINKYLVDLKEPKFRQRQILDAVFKNNIVEFEEMTTLAKDLRKKLAGIFLIPFSIACSRKIFDI